MINGTLSRILYIGALMLVGLDMAGMFVMSYAGKESPGTATVVLTSCLAFVFGTHVMPVLGTKQQKAIASQLNDKANADEQTDG